MSNQTYNNGEWRIRFIGIIIGILSLLVTVLIGWNIYKALSLEKRIAQVEQKLSNIYQETNKNLNLQEKLRSSSEEYAMGLLESMQGFSLMNNPTEIRYMLIYKCYTSAILHFLRTDRNISNYITDCLDNMGKILIYRRDTPNKYDDNIQIQKDLNKQLKK